MQYMVPEFRGQRVNQKSIFACQFYDNTYIDLHVSKVKYVTADEPLFANVLNSMHMFENEHAPDTIKPDQ